MSYADQLVFKEQHLKVAGFLYTSANVKDIDKLREMAQEIKRFTQK